MPLLASEAIVLRTYPLQEADLIVSFFTRDQGKLRGVAKRARRPKSTFGAGLERMSHVRMHYYQRENRELVNLNHCDIIHSQFDLLGDYAAAVALDYIAELSDHLLPAAEANERFFRLITAMLDHLRSRPLAGIWPVVNYFSFWAVRLSGFMPDLAIGAESREIAEEMMQTPIANLSERKWTRSTAADMRRILLRSVQEHVERKLHTPAVLETL